MQLRDRAGKRKTAWTEAVGRLAVMPSSQARRRKLLSSLFGNGELDGYIRTEHLYARPAPARFGVPGFLRLLPGCFTNTTNTVSLCTGVDCGVAFGATLRGKDRDGVRAQGEAWVLIEIHMFEASIKVRRRGSRLGVRAGSG